MSNITTIKDVLGMEGGDPIKRIQVTVKSAYPPKTGTNSYGNWTIQSAILQDETGSIRASFFGSDDNPVPNLKRFVNNQITVTSGKDGKGHISGMTAYDYEDQKKNTVTRQIEARGVFTIDEVVGGPSDAPSSENSVGPKQPVRQNSAASYVDEKGVSIEKQVALKAAVELAIAQSAFNVRKVIEDAQALYNGFFLGKSVTDVTEHTTEATSEEKVI